MYGRALVTQVQSLSRSNIEAAARRGIARTSGIALRVTAEEDGTGSCVLETGVPRSDTRCKLPTLYFLAHQLP